MAASTDFALASDTRRAQFSMSSCCVPAWSSHLRSPESHCDDFVTKAATTMMVAIARWRLGSCLGNVQDTSIWEQQWLGAAKVFIV